MTDIGDIAQERDQGFTAAALKHQATEREKEPEQLVENGEVLCVGCGEAIQPERLKAKPDAARCIYCQEIHEARRRIAL